jgi:hypothetical protein
MKPLYDTVKSLHEAKQILNAMMDGCMELDESPVKLSLDEYAAVAEISKQFLDGFKELYDGFKLDMKALNGDKRIDKIVDDIDFQATNADMLFNRLFAYAKSVSHNTAKV